MNFSKNINFHANLQQPVHRQPGFRLGTRRAEANNVIIVLKCRLEPDQYHSKPLNVIVNHSLTALL